MTSFIPKQRWSKWVKDPFLSGLKKGFAMRPWTIYKHHLPVYTTITSVFGQKMIFFVRVLFLSLSQFCPLFFLLKYLRAKVEKNIYKICNRLNLIFRTTAITTKNSHYHANVSFHIASSLRWWLKSRHEYKKKTYVCQLKS